MIHYFANWWAELARHLAALAVAMAAPSGRFIEGVGADVCWLLDWVSFGSARPCFIGLRPAKRRYRGNFLVAVEIFHGDHWEAGSELSAA